MDAALSKSERETLKAIWRITSRDAGEVGARTGDLAASLNVTPGTMTAMVKKLADRELAVHTPYHGVELTDAGRRRAMSVVRRHRIVERFLADMLGYSWAEADRLAPAFEHQLPQEVEDRLFAALDRPATCPHGFPIPSTTTDDLPKMPPLYDLAAGDRAVVALPGSTDPDVAMFLDGLGVRPGVEVEVREKHPFGGPLVVSVDGHERTLGERVARQILVRRIEQTATGDGSSQRRTGSGRARSRPGSGTTAGTGTAAGTASNGRTPGASSPTAAGRTTNEHKSKDV